MFGQPSTDFFMAEVLLSQAGISPYEGRKNEVDDQYEITLFEFSVHGIKIVNHGIEYFLKVSHVMTIPPHWMIL